MWYNAVISVLVVARDYIETEGKGYFVDEN